TLDLTLPSEASITYVPIRLGDLRGWKTRVHFYGFRDDPRLLEHMVDYAGYADGVLVCSGDKKGIDGITKKLAAFLKSEKKNYPTVVFGKPDAAKQWASSSGLAVSSTIAPSDEEMTAVKSLASEMLARLKET